ncbi:MAG: signal peptidase II [Planctomycetota bacterium]
MARCSGSASRSARCSWRSRWSRCSPRSACSAGGPRRARWAHVGIALVLAGGLGNLHDRLAFGAVRDFLHMTPRWHLPFGFRWPGGSDELFPWVFNVADVLLLAGMAVLLLTANRPEARTGGSPAPSPADRP